MLKKMAFATTLNTLLIAGAVFAQPTPPPTTPDAACGTPPNAATDTVVSALDSDGYFSLFNGKDFTGWWQSCNTAHSSTNTQQGAIFRVDTARKAIYSTQRDKAGGVLMTKKKLENYEITFDFWPDFGNDGGIFHRTTSGGKCYQTVLDYLGDGSVGGVWGEGGYPGRDIRPYAFDGSESKIKFASGANSWTAITSKLNPTDYGCAASGCVQADYLRLWDVDGWNQMRIKFYGGVTTASAIHMLSYFRKVGATPWVPVLADTVLKEATPANYLGIQVHGGGRFGAERGSWYRNIKWRPLKEDGTPVYDVPSSVKRNETHAPSQQAGSIRYDLRATSSMLTGSNDLAHEIIVRDVKGKLLGSFKGAAGNFAYPLPSNTHGLLLVSMKTIYGTQNYRLTVVGG